MSNLIVLPSGNIVDMDRVVLIAKKDLTSFGIVLAGAGAAEIDDRDYEYLKQNFARVAPTVEQLPCKETVAGSNPCHERQIISG